MILLWEAQIGFMKHINFQIVLLWSKLNNKNLIDSGLELAGSRYEYNDLNGISEKSLKGFI